MGSRSGISPTPVAWSAPHWRRRPFTRAGPPVNTCGLATAAGVPRPRADEVLEEVGLSGAADRRAGTFSLGMGQRLNLAAALLGRPDLPILDEPANGLDPEGMRWLRGLLRGFAAHGGTVLLSSHALRR